MLVRVRTMQDTNTRTIDKDTFDTYLRLGGDFKVLSATRCCVSGGLEVEISSGKLEDCGCWYEDHLFKGNLFLTEEDILTFINGVGKYDKIISVLARQY